MRLISWCICCSCIFLLVLAQLKPVKENEEENQYLLDLIIPLGNVLRSKNLVILSGNLNLHQSGEIWKSLEQRLMESVTRSVIVIGSNLANAMHLKFDRNILIIYFSDIHEPIPNVVSESVSGMQIVCFIFVYKPRDNFVLSKSAIESFFIWCWEKNISFSLLILKLNGQFEVWAYEMQPTLHIFKYTDYRNGVWHNEGYRHFSNMKQYRYAVAVYHKQPDTFVFNSSEQRDLTGNNVSLGGQAGYFMAEFLRLVNGTMEILSMSREEYFNATTYMKYHGRAIDLGATTISHPNLTQYNSVVTTTQICLVLPSDLGKTVYNFHTSGYNWSILAFSAFYFIANILIVRLNNPRVANSCIVFWQVRLFLSQPMEGRYFQRLGLPTKIIEIFTQIFNQIMFSLICAFVTMSLTLNWKKSQIVDVDSFLASDLQIMVYGNQMPSYFEANRLPMALTDRFLYVDEHTRNEHLNALNDSYAYVVDDNQWIQLKFIQIRLRNPKLRLAPESLCGIHTYQRLPLGSVNSLFVGLKWFIQYAQEIGLPDKWMMLSLRQAQMSGMIVQAPYEPDVMRALELEFFRHGFTVLILGFFLSSTAFVIELVYVRINYRRAKVAS